MQTIPVTYTHSSLESALPRKLSAQEDPSAMRYSGFSIDFYRRQSVSPHTRSCKKRLQIFKQYNPRTHLVTENDDTVVYNSRRRAADSAQGKDPKIPVYQRYSEQEIKLDRHGSHQDLMVQNTRRRSKMFSPFNARASNYRMSFFSKKQYEQEPPVTTERFTKYIESVSSIPFLIVPQRFQNSSANIESKIYLTSNNELVKAPSLQIMGLQGQLQTNLTPLCEIKQQIKQNLLNSPKKITFTYHNHNNFVGAQQIPLPVISNPSIFRQQTINKVESPCLKRSLVLSQNNSFKNSTEITHQRMGNTKKTYDFGQQTQDARKKPSHKSSMFGWGNKIRTELMGASVELDSKSPKQRDFASSKITINQLKQGLIVNGEKVARENLKINESFSNISEDQSSKRYFDEQIDVVTEVKKISYGNIEISREEFTHECQEQFKANQLLLEIQNNKFEAQKDEEIVNTSVQVKAVQTRKDEQMATERQFLGELQSLKEQLVVKQVGKTGKLLPVVLVVLASMLFVIQAIV